MKSDRIEREVVIAASQERVWTAITDPAEVSQWFGDIVEIELHPGGRARFGWTEDAIVDAIVEAVEPFRRFVYRWAAGDAVSVADGPSTLVEFTLDAVAGGTRVTVVESGSQIFHPRSTTQPSLRTGRDGGGDGRPGRVHVRSPDV